jgi:TolB protein
MRRSSVTVGAKAFPSSGVGRYGDHRTDLTGGIRCAPDSAFDGAPDWSHDGLIVFQSDRNGNMDLFTIHPDGTGLQRITTSTDDDLFPSWAPSSSKVAYVHVHGASQQVFTVNTDGSGVTQLTHTQLLKGTLAWSSNRKKIVMTAGGEETVDLYSIHSDGTHQTRLTSGPSNDFEPDWQSV